MEQIQENHNHSDTELSHEARELVLHGDNSSHLYHTSKVPIMKNLEKKFHKGVYDHDKAKKLWGYHADRAAQEYTKQYGHPGQKWHEMFSTKHRRQAAHHWADEHRDEMGYGNFHESENFAEEIVIAAMVGKPVDAHTNFKDALIERSKHLVDDKKSELAGHFMEAWSDHYETPKSKRGMWDGWSKEDLEKELKKTKADGNTKRTKEIEFALRAKSGWGKVPEETEVKETTYHLNPKKKGMWKGWSKAEIEKAKSKAKESGNTTREREATFALNAKNDWGK
jgi:hypothetical protein